MTDYERFVLELRDAEIARLEAELAVARDAVSDAQDAAQEARRAAEALSQAMGRRVGTHWRALAKVHLQDAGGDGNVAVVGLRRDLLAELVELLAYWGWEK